MLGCITAPVLQTEVGVPALQTEPLFFKKADGTIGEQLQCAADPVPAERPVAPAGPSEPAHQLAADCTGKLPEAEVINVQFMGCCSAHGTPL